MESRAAINVVAACKHAAFSEVFSSLVTRHISRLAPQRTRLRVHDALVIRAEGCSNVILGTPRSDRRRREGLLAGTPAIAAGRAPIRKSFAWRRSDGGFEQRL
jgi:hypothetical protein